jgi:hypothetical protein
VIGSETSQGKLMMLFSLFLFCIEFLSIMLSKVDDEEVSKGSIVGGSVD